MEYQAFVSVSPWTIAIQAANLLILTAILRKLLLVPVQNILNRRNNEIKSIYDEAGRNRQNAEELRTRYEAKMQRAEEETKEMLLYAEADIQKMKAEAMDRAKGEAAHIRENAKRQTETERKHAQEQLRHEVSQLAVDLAEKLMSREINAKDQQRMIEEFLESAEFES